MPVNDLCFPHSFAGYTEATINCYNCLNCTTVDSSTPTIPCTRGTCMVVKQYESNSLTSVSRTCTTSVSCSKMIKTGDKLKNAGHTDYADVTCCSTDKCNNAAATWNNSAMTMLAPSHLLLLLLSCAVLLFVTRSSNL